MRRYLAAKRGALAVWQLRGARKIDSETNSNSVATALHQDASKLLTAQDHVIRPFQHQRLAGHCDVYSFDKCQPSGKRQGLCGRVLVAQFYECAAVEIAFRRDPASALAPLPRMLI